MWDVSPAKETNELLLGLAVADLSDPLTVIDGLTFAFVFLAAKGVGKLNKYLLNNELQQLHELVKYYCIYVQSIRSAQYHSLLHATNFLPYSCGWIVDYIVLELAMFVYFT